MSEATLYGLARRALFQLDAEHAHELTLRALARAPLLTTLPFRTVVPDDPVELMGLRFRNRVGLAAGLDKNGDCIAALDRLGFGFIEIGTVTPRPQPGNPRPRLFRLPAQQALINRLGFNNKGVDHLVRQVQQTSCKAVLGINIGKNADTPLESAPTDYEQCLRKVYPWAGYVTLNLSSPNTPKLRDLQVGEPFRTLLTRITAVRKELAQRYGRRVPLLIKIAPDLSDSQLADIAVTIRAQGADGLIATNTTVQRPGLEQEPLAKEQGGLSGGPLKALSLAVLKSLRARVGADFPLMGVGGILSGTDAVERRNAGADLIQIYTGFIYRGPALVAECVRVLNTGEPGSSGISARKKA
ncbi:MAG: quinone-dependent dihydroorotate dehydrogenase [Nevskiales bacterium]|nr:quinone-dependent dihydroorotate dehydrogenase [Nevskiales bacterium]